MAGHLIRRLNQITSSVFLARMHEHGLELTSVQFAALSAIKARPGIDQASLAGLIAYDRATITGVIDRLVAKAGHEVIDLTIPTVRSLQNEILLGLTEAERETFIGLASKAAKAANLLSRAPLIVEDEDSPDRR
jgi:DNA-binding MarR family transcriptional regulator